MSSVTSPPAKLPDAPSYPPHFNLKDIIRPNILALHPYRCARDDYEEGVLLDANENALGPALFSDVPPLVDTKAKDKAKTNGDATQNPPPSAENDPLAGLDISSLSLHRYPSPTHIPIKERIAALRNIPSTDYVFLGVGSDEVIDLLMRICVKPGRNGDAKDEKILITPPTYGMYGVCAQVNDVDVVKVPLDVEGGKFQVRMEETKQALLANPTVRLLLLCSPGNPTGTLIPLSTVRELLEFDGYKGLVVVDEAYIDFAGDQEKVSAAGLVEKYANLVVMQTLSKSFGLAGVRLGIALAQPPLIQLLSNTKAPYNISSPTATLALSALSPTSLATMRTKISTILSSRDHLLSQLATLRAQSSPYLGIGVPLGGNDANFVLFPILAKDGERKGKPDNARAGKVYKAMAEEEGVVVRYRGGEYGCEGCLRVTVGSEEEVKVLLERLVDVLKRM